ncbi:cytochrome-b5 reductase [Cladophialophora psammophila CBS 110553]|uniref:Cytochrome-b5 reductase n=1 Tax=Cladophialophora psammophila CBS 110553 TaxID=1182543 RepID=W9VZZ9_9EURO|nr:cytochrome-b5 reductase [Cladophialophora psammophila CBS 110553]EXJ61387.1 cytochrome-b5 reductase [Cladophialophora psammophila CBS 110553]
MSQELTYAEVSKHNTKKDLYVVIHDKIYNASTFIDEHPGGEEVLLDVGGQDATEAFEDVGHSDEAREILDGLKVGTLKRVPGDPAPKVGATDKIAAGPGGRNGEGGTGMGVAMYAVLLIGAALAYFGYTYMQTQDKK